MGEMKLKYCPFCGDGSIIRTKSAVHNTVTVMCTHCFGQVETSAGADFLAIDRWQNRPIEDALLARAEKAEAMVEWLIEAGDYLAAFGSLRKWLVATKEYRATISKSESVGKESVE